MRISLFFCLLFAAMMIGSSQQNVFGQSKSKKEVLLTTEFTSDKLKFKTYFADKPKQTSTKRETAVGDIQLHNISHATKECLFTVHVTQYPEEIKNADNAKLLISAVDALTANGGKILARDTAAKFLSSDEKSFTATDITVEFDKNQIRTRLAVIDGTLYQVSVTGSSSAISSDAAKRFITAFELTK